MSSQFNLSTGELRHLSIDSRNSLVKIAGISDIVGKVGKGLFNYGTPVAGGATAAYGAHEAGLDPTTTAAAGLGGMAISSPGRWREIFNDAKNAGKIGKDPFNTFFKGAIKDVGIKAGITGGVALGDKANSVMNNLADTTANTAKASKSFADQSGNMATNAVTSLQGMQDTMQDIRDSTKNLASGGKAIGNSLENASNSIAEIPHAMKSGLIGAG